MGNKENGVLAAIIISLICLFMTNCGNGAKDSNSSLKEWTVGFSEGNIDNNVWGGTLYCLEEEIKWEPNAANEFVSQFFTGGKAWKIEREKIDEIGMEQTDIKGIPVTSVVITTKEGKKYFLRTNLCLENNDLMNYLIETYR